MKVQQMLGQFGGAISTFVSCRRALIDRFGIDGSNRLEELYEEILKEVSSGEADEPADELSLEPVEKSPDATTAEIPDEPAEETSEEGCE